MGFEWIFARGVEAYGREGDVFVGLTTSGNHRILSKPSRWQQERIEDDHFPGKRRGQAEGRS